MEKLKEKGVQIVPKDELRKRLKKIISKNGTTAKKAAKNGADEGTPIEEGEMPTNGEPAVVVVAHSRVLDSILEKITKVDFSALFGDIETPKQKHYLVAVIEQLLKTVEAHKYQLARKNDFVFAFNGE